MLAALPWLLSASTCANLWLLGSRRRAGFLVGLAAQPAWVAFDVSVHAYGLLPIGAVLAVVYVRGWLRWGRA